MSIEKQYNAFLKKQKPLKNPSSDKSQAKAQSLYETFHGRKAKTARQITIPTPKALIVLGRCVAVEYECDKLNGVKSSKAGKKNVFRHEMPKDNTLSTNESGTMLYIRGSKLSIKQSGINH